MLQWRDHKRQYSLGGWSDQGGARQWGGARLSHSRLAQKAVHTGSVQGHREASVPHIKTAGVTDRVPLLQACMVCTVHKSRHCVKGHVLDEQTLISIPITLLMFLL